MNFQFYLEKLKVHDGFQNFSRENPRAFLCSAFFSIDKKGNDNKQHFDYFVSAFQELGADARLNNSQSASPDCSLKKNSLKENFSLTDKSVERFDEVSRGASINNQAQRGKIFSFQLENNCEKVELENYSGEIPSQISSDYDFEFENIEKMILDKMKEQGIKSELQKILFSLQNAEGIDWLIGTIFISGFGMINFKVDLGKMEIINFEKKSVFDIMKVVRKK